MNAASVLLAVIGPAWGSGWGSEFLIRATILLAAGWVIHAALRKANPRWRVLTWRGVASGMFVVAAMGFWPATIALPILPAVADRAPGVDTNVGPVASPSATFQAPALPSELRDQRPQLAVASSERVQQPSLSAKAAPAASRSQSVARAPRTTADWLLAVWVTGVAVAGLRFLIGAWRLKRTIAAAPPAPETVRSAALTLARVGGVRSAPDVRTTDAPGTPYSAGILRGVIMLPTELCQSGREDDLQGALGHELAHLAGRDLAWNALLELVAAALWFHPLAWRLRLAHADACDQRCDAVAASLTADAAGYIRLLARFALQAGGRGPALALPMARTPQIMRRVTLLRGRCMSARLRRIYAYPAAAVLVALAFVVGAGELTRREADAQQTIETTATTGATEQSQEITVQVVDARGQSVADLEVRLWAYEPTFDEQWIEQGTNIRTENASTYARTDAQGTLKFRLPVQPKNLQLYVVQPGYAPYYAAWSLLNHPQPLPRQFTMQLDDAWTIGGKVVNEEGEPVVGATIRPSIRFKNRPDARDELHIGNRFVTDADGSWKFESVPVDMNDVTVELQHADYQPMWQTLGRGTFEVKPNATPGVVTLKRGLSLVGTVTDDAGQPIAGATIRTKFNNDVRTATSDEAGRYKLSGCEPNAMTRVVASAPGKALDLKTVRVDDGMEPVDFQLKPGNKIRIRVVDEQGQGIPKARIFFQRWRGHIDYFEFDHVNQYADEQGVWEWNEAPADGFAADICRPDGMQLSEQLVVPREEEYVFTPPRALVATGRVVDAETKQPIAKFRVIPGLRNADPRIGFNWIPRDAYDATDGTYRMQFTHAYPAHLVRIEAEGYGVAISRDIRTDEGEVTIDFALEKAADIVSTVVTAAGEPAAGAKIALGVAGSQITINEGDIDDDSTYATRLETDANGVFLIPARGEAFQIVVTHPEGFAHLKSADGPIAEKTVLTPWARMEGTFRVGSEPVPNVVLSLYQNAIQSYGPDVANIFTHHDVTTGSDGRFVLERVFPGQGRIGRRILRIVDQGATEVTSSLRAGADFVAGETTHLDIGGSGRAVTGRFLAAPGNPGKTLWSFAVVFANPGLIAPPMREPPDEIKNDQAKYSAWRTEYLATPEGLAWRAAYAAHERQMSLLPVFEASVDNSGAFRIDDVPPGEYVLSVRASEQPVGQLRDYRFKVTDEGTGVVDLGEIQLQ